MSFTLNRDKFFAGYRSAVASLNQPQTDGLNFLLGKLEQDSFSLNQAAYILATVDHETEHTFQPVKEKRDRANSSRRANQDRYWLTGFYGRGYVQITWEKNYAKFGIADTPDKALEPETAYMILSRGMREGLFTGKKLSDFIYDGRSLDYFNARTIINGHDKAQEIAERAHKYATILTDSHVTDPPADSGDNGVEPEKPVDEDKGVTTGENKTEESGTLPPAPAVEIKASEVSWVSKLTSLSIPTGVAGVLAAIANFVKGVPPYVWVAFAGVVVVAMVIGFIMWRDKNQQAHERTLKLMDAGASKTLNNLRLVATLPAPREEVT